MPCGEFLANRLNEPKSQSDTVSMPLPKSPVSSSQYDVVPQMIIRSPNVRPGEFAIGDAKRILQHYRQQPDMAEQSDDVRSLGVKQTSSNRPRCRLAV